MIDDLRLQKIAEAKNSNPQSFWRSLEKLSNWQLFQAIGLNYRSRGQRPRNIEHIFPALKGQTK
ncbi:MAG TPA: hypothetical protein VIK59_08910 [Verrucomicrobiae bacterium]